MAEKKIKAANSEKLTRYSDSFLTRVPYFAVKHGKVTNAIVASEIGCCERSVIRWRQNHPEFDELMKDPLSSDLGKNYERVIGNMLHGRTVTERDEEGNITKEITYSPTPQDLILPKTMGYMVTDRAAKQAEHDLLTAQRATMKPHVARMIAGEINVSELLMLYHTEGIEPPNHLVKEHAHALDAGHLSTQESQWSEEKYNQMYEIAEKAEQESKNVDLGKFLKINKKTNNDKNYED